MWWFAWLAVTPFEEGLALAGRGEWAAARAQFARAVQEEPRQARAWKALGVASGKLEDTAASEEAFGRACQLEPKLLDVCYYHARALYVLNRFEPALAALERVRRLDPRVGRTWVAIGQTHEALGQAAKAEEAFRQALAEPDAPVEAREHFGIFLFRAGRLDEAARWLGEARRRAPRQASIALELGRVYYQQGQLPQAIAELEAAVALDPRSPPARLLLDRARRRAGALADPTSRP